MLHAVYEILSFFQAKTASLSYSLHNLELCSTNLGEDHIERRFLLCCLSCAASSRTSSYSNSCSSRLNTILVLQDCCQLINFLNCEVYQLLSNSFNICHFILNLILFLLSY